MPESWTKPKVSEASNGGGTAKGQGMQKGAYNVAERYWQASHTMESMADAKPQGKGTRSQATDAHGQGTSTSGQSMLQTPNPLPALGIPSPEEEIEMSRRVVARAAEIVKDQAYTDELRNRVLAEASKYMAEWLMERGAAVLGAGSTADTHMASMLTLQRCHRLVGEAASLLEAKRAEEEAAQATAAVAKSGA